MKEMSKRLTYGEAHIVVKQSLCMIQGEWVTMKKPTHKPRMKRENALKYYSKKIKKIWEASICQV